jgi:hypothetical protein
MLRNGSTLPRVGATRKKKKVSIYWKYVETYMRPFRIPYYKNKVLEAVAMQFYDGLNEASTQDYSWIHFT